MSALQKMEEVLNEYPKHVERFCDVTKYGQVYGIVVTKFMFVYEIKVFIDVGVNYTLEEIGIYCDNSAPEAVYSFEMKNQRRSESDCNIALLTQSQHTTEHGMRDKLKMIKDCLMQPTFTQGLSLFGEGFSGSKRLNSFNVVKIPNDWDSNPSKYLLRGDLILSQFNPLGVFHFFHAGIYLGGGEVAHLSGHGQGKFSAKARIASLEGDFAPKGGWIAIVVFNPMVRARADVAKVAEDRVNEGFVVEGEYHLTKNNCQQFAFSCVTDADYCIDTKLSSWWPAPT